MAGQNAPPPALCLSTRLALALLCFCGSLMIYALRTNLSFAIVCMAKPVNTTGGAVSKASECPPDPAAAKSTPSPTDVAKGEFDWSKETQGRVLSAFFWGYMGSQILGGLAAARFGGKRVLQATVLGSSLITLLSPIAARTSVHALVGLRAALGFLQGGIFPGMHTMWSLWAPPLERSVLTGLSYAGAQIGNVLVMPLSGFLCEFSIDGGWPLIFYSLGLVGLLWCISWQLFAADRPGNHKRISTQERDYIEQSLGQGAGGKGAETRHSTPWLSILRSRAVWGIYIGHFAGDWGAYTMATCLPSFLKDILGLDTSSLGVVSAIPYIFYFLVINVGGAAADFVQTKGLLNTLNTRRAAMLLALGGQGAFLVAAGYCGCGQGTLFIILITIGMAISGLQYAGFVVNYLDIAPLHAGTILGIGNTLSCVGGIISPWLIGVLTPNGTRAEWQQVLWLTFGILVAGALAFCLLASGEEQPWARAKRSADDEEALPLEEEGTTKKGSAI